MPRSLNELFTAQNEELFNMLFRHQVYLEGFKTGLANDYQVLLRHIYGEFAIFLRQTRYDRMDQFTKVQLLEFIRKFTIAQGSFYSSYTDQLIKRLQAFLAFEVDLHTQIMTHVTGKTIADANTPLTDKVSADEYSALTPGLQAEYAPFGNHYQLKPEYAHNAQASGIYGVAVLDNTDESNARLWGYVTRSPMPASGTFMLDAVAGFGDMMNKRVAALINYAYANAMSASELEQILLGKGDAFAGGVLGNFLNWHTALLATVVQHVSAETQTAVDSLFYERYQWVAILDNKTTIICRQRDGTVYIYGEGPLPPAHFNCRSKAVPVASGTHLHEIPETYYDWLLTQPRSFLDDVLGAARADALLAGNSPATTFAQIATIRPLTLTEFTGKVKYILGDA